jgi:hypothetical protein
MMRALIGGCSLALLVIAVPAAADERDSSGGDAKAGLGTHQKHVRLELGVRTQFVSNEGLDPFSEDDVVPELALGASWAFWARDRLSIAGVVGFDYGSLSSNVRSSEASLDVMRFTLGPEARYHVLRLLVLTAKLAPTLTRQGAEIATGFGEEQSMSAWKLGFDALAGAAVEVVGERSGGSHRPRLWIAAEGGYGWTAPTDLTFEPGAGAPQRLDPLALGELSLSGPLFRVTGAVSFW